MTVRRALLVIAFGLVASRAAADVPAGWTTLPIAATGTYALRYVPPGLDQSQPVPVIVFLHGSGATPEQWRSLVAPAADANSAVLLVPKSVSSLGFGPGADETTIREGLRVLGEGLVLDPARLSVAGHSSGGALAAVLVHASRLHWSAAFILGAPYRIVLERIDPDYAAPVRMYYGDLDPNYLSGNPQAYTQQWDRLGAPWHAFIATGFGHSGYPPATFHDGFEFLVAQRYATAQGCVPSDTRLCLRQGRFAVEAHWRRASGESGPGHVSEARTTDSGLFWFFRPDNWELQVKVLDACGLNARYWVFAAGTTNVEYSFTVRDLTTGQSKTYEFPEGPPSPATTDTGALAVCP